MDQELLRIFAGKEELLPYVDAWIVRVSQGADPHDSTSSSPSAAVAKNGIVLDGVVGPVDCSPASFNTGQVESTAQIDYSLWQPVILTVPSCPAALIWSPGKPTNRQYLISICDAYCLKKLIESSQKIICHFSLKKSTVIVSKVSNMSHPC
jgi:hypothetical protein